MLKKCKDLPLFANCFHFNALSIFCNTFTDMDWVREVRYGEKADD